MLGTLEERVAYLEGKVEEQSHLGSELREMVMHLDQKVDRFREELSARIDAIDHKFSRYFLWIIGIQTTILLAIIVTLLR